MKHSKGPWQVIRSHGVTKVVDYYGQTICDDEDYYPEKLDPDNADIIAASPELLDTVKAFHDWWYSGGCDCAYMPSQLADMIDNSIAKAEGRTV